VNEPDGGAGGSPSQPAESVEVLVIGAGVSGLSFANWIHEEAARREAPPPSLAIVEAAAEPGGYCRTVAREGFVWDYSGHFFHFAHPEIEAWLRARMPGQDVRTVARCAKIRYRGRDLDFPFQAHLHQLEQAELIECLVDLHEAARQPPAAPPRSFKQMLYQRLGKAICEKFLVPYNEKLYACDLDRLDPQAMGRFFPHADLDAVIRNMRPQASRSHGSPGSPGSPGSHSYNATFTYPAGGAIEYVRALLRELPPETLALDERVVAVDLAAHVATTSRRRIAYRHLVSSAPLPELARACALPAPPETFSANKVVVFNLGFDRKGPRDVHWMYVPDPARVFYRVGWYDNIIPSDRMSLYVEIGAGRDAVVDVEATLARVLADLRAEEIVQDHRLVAWHHVVLAPAYVHLTTASIAATAELRAALAASDVHSVGRYGGWTYCSIEDNLIETRALAARLAPVVIGS
jgi:protoporphyrinogen oxidase